MNQKKDYYEILGLAKNSSIEEVKKSFKTLARKYHPDANKNDPNAESKFQEISEAYSVLSDPDKKKAYDQFGHASEQPGFNQGGFGGFGGFQGFSGFAGGQAGDFFSQATGAESFDDLIKSIFRGGSAKSRNVGDDIAKKITINLADVIFGKEIALELDKEEECPHCHGTKAESPEDIKTCDMCNGRGKILRNMQTPFGVFQSEAICPKCQGSGKIIKNKCHVCKGKGFLEVKEVKKIKIPQGIENGQKLILKGYGKMSKKATKPGDLYLIVEVAKHKYFTREDNDLILDLPITLLDALMGAIVHVPTFYGEVKIEIPENTKPDTVLKIRKKGVPYNNGKSYGDLYIRLKIESINNISISKSESVVLKGIQERVSPKINKEFCQQVNKSLR